MDLLPGVPIRLAADGLTLDVEDASRSTHFVADFAQSHLAVLRHLSAIGELRH